MSYLKPPGVFDILPKEDKDPWRAAHLWQYVEEIIHKTARDYSYHEIRTPIFERTELFARGIGEETDIVSKEMYTFTDRGDRSLTLRPEGTAPCVRAFLENNLPAKGQVHKLYYIGPMFRYERQQAGRFRQHHQFGAEAFGSRAPEQDVELIDLVHTLYRRLGLSNLTIQLNNIGTAAARLSYRERLVAYFQENASSLSDDSRRRLEFNPLRILDSKDAGDRKIVANAPLITNHLDEESQENFSAIKKLLESLAIPYVVNPFLVRGLDYYNGTVFEVQSGSLGAQNSVGGGGRYDGLIETLGGAPSPAVGFATGIERILQTLIAENCPQPAPAAPTIYLVAIGDAAESAAFQLLHTLRTQSISADMDFSGKKPGKALQLANNAGARFAAIIGDAELETGEVELKDMATGHSQRVKMDTLAETVTG